MRHNVLVEATLSMWHRLELFFAVRPVVDGTLGNPVSHLHVALVVHDGADGTVDGQLLPVHAQPGDLSVEVRKVAALQQGVVAKANARDNVRSAKCNLLNFGEILVDHAIEDHLTDGLERNELLRP